MAIKTAADLNENDVVDIMGVEYQIESVKRGLDTSIDLFLERTNGDNAYVLINIHPTSPVHTK